MDAPAIVMMVLFLLVIWGGLVASIVHYVGHPDEPDEATARPTSKG
ncbi:MAG: methionine/alanine import family NSS transporter small subunit [Dietzia sp.]